MESLVSVTTPVIQAEDHGGHHSASTGTAPNCPKLILKLFIHSRASLSLLFFQANNSSLAPLG